MPWNGSGVFNRSNGVNTGAEVWQDDAGAGVKIRADRHDTHDEDIATGLENTITRDGQNSPTASLPMNSQKHTGVAATSGRSSRTEYLATGVAQDGDVFELGSVAGTDTITASATPAVSAYTAGQIFRFVAAGTNTGATTININSAGAKAIQKLGAALVAGDITAGDAVEIYYDGTQFQMLSPARTPVLTAGGIATAAIADDAVTYAKMQDVTATQRVLGRNTAGSGSPEEVTLSQLLDWVGSAAQGDILYRGSSGWARLGAGTSGQFLKTQGAGSNPAWDDAGGITAGTPLVMNPFATNTSATQAHGLGAHPSFLDYELECLTAEHNWSIGDKVKISQWIGSGLGGNIWVEADATNISAKVNNSSFAAVNKTTFASVTLTAGNWKLTITPYLVS